MKYTFDVAFLPCEALKKHDARIVVDLLRATTQITTFFDMGGEVLVPVTEVDEAFAMKEKLGEDWKIMGERGGLPAPGFDFGNSPLELQAAGAPEHAIITTSNGTRAIMRAVKDCAHVIAGCARNAEAAAWDAGRDYMRGAQRRIFARGHNLRRDARREAAGARALERRRGDGADRRRDGGDVAVAVDGA